jgi:hypothetical protein
MTSMPCDRQSKVSSNENWMLTANWIPAPAAEDKGEPTV